MRIYVAYLATDGGADAVAMGGRLALSLVLGDGAAGFADVAVSPMSFTVEVPEARLDEAVTASCAVGVARQPSRPVPSPKGSSMTCCSSLRSGV